MSREPHTPVRLLRDLVLVRPTEPAESTRGGVFLPDNAKDKPGEGQVVAVGSGAVDKRGMRSPIGVTVGDTVLFSRGAGLGTMICGEQMLILSEREVLAILYPSGPLLAAAAPRPNGKRDVCIRRTGTPIWVVIKYFRLCHSKLRLLEDFDLTEHELAAALAHYELQPDPIDERLEDLDDGVGSVDQNPATARALAAL